MPHDITEIEKQCDELRQEFDKLKFALKYLGLPIAELEESYCKHLEEINKRHDTLHH